MKFGKFIAVILSLLIIISAFPVIASAANETDTVFTKPSLCKGGWHSTSCDGWIGNNEQLKSLIIIKINDLQANVVTDFVFDLIGRPQGIKMSNGQRLHISYDNLNRVSLSKWSLNGISQLTEYIYGSNTVSGQKNGLIYGVKNNGNQVISYNYDELCRLASRTLNTTTPYITEYGYLEGSAPNTTTALIKTLKNGNDIYEYSYDDVGNITEVKLNNVVTESYTYDNLGQLTSATYNGDTYTYLYDNGGNITEVKKNGTVIKAYTYGNTEWKDLLTAFNGTAITYDTIGNPLSYRDGYSFTWANGRQLTAISQNNNTLASYTYNADGLRTSKTVNGVTTNYYWINGILQGQKTGDEYIIFLYDENGTAYGMLIKNGTLESAYYYIRNLQGDIIGILDSTGTQVVSYTYGVWGDVLSVSGTLANTVGQQNPLRYRGYYYDSETGFYYLQSRYYDTEIGRWISPEPNVFSGAFDDGAGLIGYNIYTYCANNPIFLSDTTGEFIISTILIGVAVGGLVGATLGGTVAYNSGKSAGLKGKDLFLETMGGAAKGFMIGGTAGGLFAATGSTITLYGIKSTASTIMVTGTSSMLARTTEVTALQYRKSVLDGKNNWQISNDCLNSVFYNGGKIISPAFTKVGTTSANYIATDLIKHKVVPLKFNTFLQSTGGKLFPYLGATYNLNYAAYSFFCPNPYTMANQRGYILR